MPPPSPPPTVPIWAIDQRAQRDALPADKNLTLACAVNEGAIMPGCIDNLLSSLHLLSLASYCLLSHCPRSKASAVASVRIPATATAATNIIPAKLIFALHGVLELSVGGERITRGYFLAFCWLLRLLCLFANRATDWTGCCFCCWHCQWCGIPTHLIVRVGWLMSRCLCGRIKISGFPPLYPPSRFLLPIY